MDTRGNIHIPPMSKEDADKLFDRMQQDFSDRIVDLKRAGAKIKTDSPIPEDAVPLRCLPDPKCTDCYGRGQITRIIENVRRLEVCHCCKAQAEEEAQ